MMNYAKWIFCFVRKKIYNYKLFTFALIQSLQKIEVI